MAFLNIIYNQRGFPACGKRAEGKDGKRRSGKNLPLRRTVCRLIARTLVGGNYTTYLTCLGIAFCSTFIPPYDTFFLDKLNAILSFSVRLGCVELAVFATDVCCVYAVDKFALFVEANSAFTVAAVPKPCMPLFTGRCLVSD